MEKFAVGYRIQCKLLYCIGTFRHIHFSQLHNHFRNLETASAYFIASSALQTNILNLRSPLLGYQEMRKQGSYTARIYVRTVDMTAYQRKSGTYVKTGAAPYTIEHLAEILIGKNFSAAGVVKDYAVKIFLFLFVRFLINGNFTGAGIH